MKFISLTKYFYQHTQEEYETEYIRRLEAPFTVHFNIPIHQYNRKSAYPAFLCYTGEILRLVEKFYKTYEQFLYTVNTVPPVVLYQFTRLSIVEEVKSTNDIEGVRSTKKEIREIIEKKGTHYHRLQSVVHQYLELLGEEEIKFDTCQDIRNFYDDFTHQEITRENPQNRLDGSLFRKEPVQIEAATGKIIHQGLYPESRIIEALDQALRILHSEEYPLLIRLALFHYFFVYIHPFYDGNGRTDRFITSYFLSRQFHRLLAVRLSIYIKRNQSRYYHMLEEADSERNRGDMTPFVMGFLEILIGSTEDTIGVLSRKNEQMRKYESRIDAFQLQDKLLKEIYITLLQAALFYGEGISMADLMKVTGKNRGTIQKRIDEIPGNHLIVTKAGKTNYYKLNLMLFKEN
ncbi:Fic family protein [Dialister succinatiphilus]|uniref:Fic family protein n=1 Tax=Dialister succinatiphilus TaxID=487173 RepID=UPI002355E73A|nr:Fic family protein [Dialister succinatiphilus]